MNYKVRYVIINSNEIFNLTDQHYLPEVSSKFMKDDRWWSEPKFEELRDIINDYYIKRYDELTGHYSNLEKSILEKGFLNPVLITAGPPQMRKMKEIPPYLRSNPENLLLSEHLGGSRIYIAQKYDMDIPCIVSDFVNRFEDAEELKTCDEIIAKFETPDAFHSITFTNKGVHTTTKTFIHIPDPSYTFSNQSKARSMVVREILKLVDKWVKQNK